MMSGRLRVLITNKSLVTWTGTEVYARDLARKLQARGLCPVVYSQQWGKVAQELMASTIPVVRSLQQLGAPPDIIHGHHLHPTLCALTAFPGVPAIYFCHDWSAWHDAPLSHPRIGRYIAVDQTCRDRLICTGSIPPNKVIHLPNWADLNRYRMRSSLPSTPRRMLVFSSLYQRRRFRDPVQRACRAADVELAQVGYANRRVLRAPEHELLRHDIVLAKGKSAMEAIASGAAVVLFGYNRIGPMVTSKNWETLYDQNFGRRAIGQPLSVDSVLQAIRAYDPADALEVARLFRQRCDIQPAVDRLIGIYGDVIDEFKRGSPCPQAEAAALTAYLERAEPMLDLGADRWLRKQYTRQLWAWRPWRRKRPTGPPPCPDSADTAPTCSRRAA
ncbi:MAG: hypothetical protein D6753_18895 [Planctomycetota bacterium]|nr:MAG: hypothetical protein D6753_18895 [Planctomycetota bacterium]